MTNITLRALLITAILASTSAFGQDRAQFGASTTAQPTSYASDARCTLDEDNARCNPLASN
jgi:hypothetical protein